jgi:LuxR family transcriptional regulator, maltose regulon positive regulatory protein
MGRMLNPERASRRARLVSTQTRPAPEIVSAARSGGAGSVGAAPPAAPFDFVASKVRVPAVAPDSVSRVGLVNRLRAASSSSVALVAAPAGYGKTTLLAQWAGRDERPFAWVTVDPRDNDPVILLRHIAVAVDGIAPLGPAVLEALRSARPMIWRVAVPRLASAVAALEHPFVLVLDAADLLESKASLDVIATLAEQIPEGSMLVLAGRAAPRLGIARMRAEGRLFEIGPEMLALSRREARLLLRATGVELNEGEVVELVRRTEGWPAGLFLAALSLRDRNRKVDPSASISGDDRYVAEYLRFEHLSQLSPEMLTFLRRSSVLDKMSGSLCDAVLETEASGPRLESMRESNLFLVPLDDRCEWYRYHELFADLLRHDLAQREAEQIPALNRRAADWYEANGDPESALERAAESGDMDRAARIFASIALPTYHRGRLTAIEGWLDHFSDDVQLARYPGVAAFGGWVHALRGRASEAERWVLAAESDAAAGPMPDGSSSARPATLVIRATMCRDGVERMLSDAQAALVELPADSQWRPWALVMHGAAHVLLGDDERGDVILAEAVDESTRLGFTGVRIVALSERSLVAAARGDVSEADALAFEAHELTASGRLDGYPTVAVGLAACARARLRHGRWDQARTDLANARRLSRSLTDALPWLAVQCRLELAHAHVTLRDADGARQLLAEIREILTVRPQLGVLAGRADELGHEIDMMPIADGNVSGLTSAELRVLPLLTTHLSFREIGERLFVSRNTIKTQAISIYRKLGVSSRSGAIERAAELGLIEMELTQSSAELIRSV